MPSNEQDLFDISYIFDSIDSFTEGIERHFESVSSSLKDTFRASPWLPDSIKPLPPPPSSYKAPVVPIGYLAASRNWVSEHRAVTAAVVAFVGTGAFIIWRRRRSHRAKRRAKKAKNGSRTEVVVVAGSPHSPLTRSLSLELERRGFIVYIPVNSLSEEQLIQSESRADIKPLNLDITSPGSTEETISKFTKHINTPQHPISKAPSHSLHLSAIVLVPGTTLPPNPIASITPSTWSDSLNSCLLAPFTTLHAFLPLIASQRSNILFLTPSIIPSLTPPSHAAESVIAGGLQQYISTLRREVQGQDINVVKMQLGQFDYGLAVGDDQQQLVLSQHLSAAKASRQSLEKKGIIKKTGQGTSLRKLHNDVFDAIVRGKGKNGTIFVGRGSRTYDLVGKWVPNIVIGWMMGEKVKVETPVSDSAEHESSSEASFDKVGERDSDEEAYVYPKDR